jgi:hypothetical protein
MGAGYSPRTLVEKLGIKPHTHIAIIGAPRGYRSRFPLLKRSLTTDGTLWVSWPKKASGVTTDLTEDGVRAVALAHGLVDVKVCAVDEVWSGLKLVRRLRDR